MSVRCAPLLVLAFAGCAGETQRPVEEPQEQRASATPGPAVLTPTDQPEALTAAPALIGEYRVAAAGGQPIDMPHGITATIDAQTIKVNASCVNFAWSYRFVDARLVTEAVPVVSCQRGLFPEEEAVRAAFDAAEAVARLPSNGIEFSGGGHSVVLFSQ